MKISSSLESPSPKAKVKKIQEVSWWSSYQTSSVFTIPKKLNANAYIVLERRETALAWVMKYAFKLKETDFKIFEDPPKELFSLSSQGRIQ